MHVPPTDPVGARADYSAIGSCSFGELHALAQRYAAALAGARHRAGRRGRAAIAQDAGSPMDCYWPAFGLALPMCFSIRRARPSARARMIEQVRPKILFTAEPALPIHYGATHADVRRRRSLAGAVSHRPAAERRSRRDRHRSRLHHVHLRIDRRTEGRGHSPSGRTEPDGMGADHARRRAAPERFTNINPLHFDNSVFDIYCGLLNGAALVPVETGEITNPATWVKDGTPRRRRPCMFAVPTLFLILDQLGLLTPEGVARLSAPFIFGGEGYPIGKLRDFHDRFAGTRAARQCLWADRDELHLLEHRASRTSILSAARQANFRRSAACTTISLIAILDENEQMPVARGESANCGSAAPASGSAIMPTAKKPRARFRQDPRQDRLPRDLLPLGRSGARG